MKKGYLPRPRISPDSELKFGKSARRHRRLRPDVPDEKGQVKEPGEERRLLEHANPRLQRLIIAALETGCRQGELLSLVWGDLDLARGRIYVRAEHAKEDENRFRPISTRLRAVLEMAKTDPAGNRFPPTAYVFGDSIGGRIESLKTAAWLFGRHKLAGGIVGLFANTSDPELLIGFGCFAARSLRGAAQAAAAIFGWRIPSTVTTLPEGMQAAADTYAD